MVAGHFGFAAIVKSRAPRAPLWALMLATQWMDVLFVPMFLAHLEPMEVVPGADPGYGKMLIHAEYTHSLIGALVLASLFGLVAAIWWGQRTGAVLGGVVFSHWLIDLVVHREDMPIFPGGAGPHLGFGLWRAPVVTAVSELALVVVGAYLYWRAAVRVSLAADVAPRRAHLVAALVLVGGVAVLAMNLAGS